MRVTFIHDMEIDGRDVRAELTCRWSRPIPATRYEPGDGGLEPVRLKVEGAELTQRQLDALEQRILDMHSGWCPGFEEEVDRAEYLLDRERDQEMGL